MFRLRRREIRRKHKGMKHKAFIPLTEIDIGDFNSIDLYKTSVNELKALQYNLEGLRHEVQCNKPADPCSIEYRFWSQRLFRVDNYLYGVLDLLEKLGDQTTGPKRTAFSSLPAPGPISILS